MKTAMSLIRKTLNAVLYLGYVSAASCILLEVVSRLLPVAEVFEVQPVIQETPIIRFNSDQSAIFSLGWDFYQTAQKSTNNLGYVSSLDYVTNGKPDIVVVGDSYVEAMQVDNAESVSEVLMALYEDLSVYALGISGVPLSQYIKFVEYAEETFPPSEYLILVVGNDFDESICSIRPKQGAYCFDENWELKLIEFPGYSLVRSVARKSAFIRYLVFNLGINWREVITRIGWRDPGVADSKGFAGNTERMKRADVVKSSYKVIDEFVLGVRDAANNKKITLLIDADLSDIYEGVRKKSYFRDMRSYLIDRANRSGIHVIDMEPVFAGHYAVHGRRFEFPTDGHWNELGHELAAEAYLRARPK